MSPIPTPSATPDQPKTLAEWAEDFPKCHRHLVALIAEHVKVEGEALKVRAFKSACFVHAQQLALFSYLATRSLSDDDEWYPVLADFIEHVNRERSRMGLKTKYLGPG